MNYKLKSVKCCFDLNSDKLIMSKLESYGFKFGTIQKCNGCWINQHGFINIKTLDDLNKLIDDFGCSIILAKDYIMLYNQFDMHCEACRTAIGLQA